MKSAKIIIGALILASTFNACKKDEINSQPGEIGLSSAGRSNNELVAEAAGASESEEITKVSFDRSGTITTGNQHLQKLIDMYNGSDNANEALNNVFAITGSSSLTVVFDRNGKTIISDLPLIPVGSTIDALIFDLCKIKLDRAVTMVITNNSVEKSHEEFFNAMPAGLIEQVDNNIKKAQSVLADGATATFTFNLNHVSDVSVSGPGLPPTGPSWIDCPFDPDSITGWVWAMNCVYDSFFGWY